MVVFVKSSAERESDNHSSQHDHLTPRVIFNNWLVFLYSLWICPSFCVTWLWTWQKRQWQRVNRQSRTGL